MSTLYAAKDAVQAGTGANLEAAGWKINRKEDEDNDDGEGDVEVQSGKEEGVAGEISRKSQIEAAPLQFPATSSGAALVGDQAYRTNKDQLQQSKTRQSHKNSASRNLDGAILPERLK